MSDNLDTLSDRELDELFAVEVAGWTKVGAPDQHIGQPLGTPACLSACWVIPSFTTDANAVLPWLEKQPNHILYVERWFSEHGVVSLAETATLEWAIGLVPKSYYNSNEYEADTGYRQFMSTAPTFARAAVIALLRAKRAEKAP